MIAPWIFYAMVMSNNGQITVIDVYRDASECEEDSRHVVHYYEDTGYTGVTVRCMPTRHHAVNLVQKNIESIKKIEIK